MANLTKLRLNSNEYALGSSITKINVNGSIYGIGKDRNTVGVNGAIGMNNSYPNLALNIGSTSQNTIAKDGNRYAAIQVPDGLYNGGSYVGVKTTDVGIYESDIRHGKSIFGVVGQFTGDANLPASSVVESYHGYAQGNHIYGSIPKRSEVGYNGVIGISDAYPKVGVVISNDVQYNLCTNGQYTYCVKVPEGYYNGWSYIGANFSKLCADGTDSWMASWGSYAELLTYALSISSQISDTNYIQIRAPYRHQRHFRLIVTTNVNSQVLITKNYNDYKRVTTDTSTFKLPYYDLSWTDYVNPNDSFRVHIDNSSGNIQGVSTLCSWI